MSLILTIQGCFYIATGLWPLVHMQSFEAVSGHKTDKWLVRTVSLMILSSGIVFIRFSDSKPAVLLALMNALSLSFIDVYYSFKGMIRKVYLADAVVEVMFVLMILFA